MEQEDIADWGDGVNKGLEAEVRPSCGESGQRGRELLSVSWEANVGGEGWGQKVELKLGKAGKVEREALPVTSSLPSRSHSWLRVTLLPRSGCSRCLLMGRMLTT